MATLTFIRKTAKMNNPIQVTLYSGAIYMAYGINVEDAGSKNNSKSPFDDPFAFNDYDLWLGDDLNFFLDNLLDDIFREIESDITSVWSTNESEQISQQLSAQLSADAKARGETTMSADTVASVTNSLSGEHSAKLGFISTTSVSSSDSAATSTASPTHSHSSFYGYGDSSHLLESRHSGTASKNKSGDTNGSFSHGTSQGSGSASTLSSVSIKIKPFKNFFENTVDNQQVTVLQDVDDKPEGL